ncbi:glycosyltransferase [Wenyingzhuangia sp. IMCC45574]
MKTGIIISCYNEASGLDATIFNGFSGKDYHICFVNNGSSDNTLEVLKSVKAKAPRSISIVNVDKRTLETEAVQKGVLYLDKKEDVTYVGFVKANLSADLMRTLKVW